MATLSNPSGRTRVVNPVDTNFPAIPVAHAEKIRVGLANPPSAGNSVEDFIADLITRLAAADTPDFRGEWDDLDGQRLVQGETVLHNGAYFIVTQTHVRGAAGPDGDPDRFDLLTNYRPSYTANTWYAEGTILRYAARWWIANEDVEGGDPAPGAPGNTKWIATDRSPASVPSITTWSVDTPQEVAAGTTLEDMDVSFEYALANIESVMRVRIVGRRGTSETVLATFTPPFSGHRTGHVRLDGAGTLAAEETYRIDLRVYDSAGADAVPVATHDFTIRARSAEMVHYGVIAQSAAIDTDLFDNDIGQAASVSEHFAITGIPSTGLHQFYFAVPADHWQPRNWYQLAARFDFALNDAIERLVNTVTIDSVSYLVYRLRSGNAVDRRFNGAVIAALT